MRLIVNNIVQILYIVHPYSCETKKMEAFEQSEKLWELKINLSHMSLLSLSPVLKQNKVF